MTAAPRPAQVRRLGRVPYALGLAMQAELAELVGRGGPDQVLLLEHNPVFTLGRNASMADIHASDEFLAENGVEVHQTDRGGQVTYHGPGQIVAYPICNLRGGRQDVRGMVRGLERAMIDAAADFGVRAERLDGHPGVWVGAERGWEKLGAIGVHLKKWVSTHGLAFNVAPDMDRFKWITPCGIADKGVCSLRTLLGGARPSWDEARDALERRLLDALGLDPLPAPGPSRSVSVAVWRRGPGGPEMLAPRDGGRSNVAGAAVQARADEAPGTAAPRRLDGGWTAIVGPVRPAEAPEAAAARVVLEALGETCPAGRPEALGVPHTSLVEIGPDGPIFSTEAQFRLEAPPGACAAPGGYAWLPCQVPGHTKLRSK